MKSAGYDRALKQVRAICLELPEAPVSAGQALGREAEGAGDEAAPSVEDERGLAGKLALEPADW